MYIVAIAKIADSQQIIALINYLFCIILSIRPISLTVELCCRQYQIDIWHVKCEDYRWYKIVA